MVSVQGRQSNVWQVKRLRYEKKHDWLCELPATHRARMSVESKEVIVAKLKKNKRFVNLLMYPNRTQGLTQTSFFMERPIRKSLVTKSHRKVWSLLAFLKGHENLHFPPLKPIFYFWYLLTPQDCFMHLPFSSIFLAPSTHLSLPSSPLSLLSLYKFT